MKKYSEKMFFENIGGSFQFRARCAADLRKIISLDAAAWAALCVPTAALNGDIEFFKAVDCGNTGMIRIDEVKQAIGWLFKMLKNFEAVDQESDVLRCEMFNDGDADGKALKEFALQHFEELTVSSGSLELSTVRAKLDAVRSGVLSGDGLLKARAVADSGAATLYRDITTVLECQDKLTLETLKKFLLDAKNFAEWSKTAEKPCFRGHEPEKYYALYQQLSGKIDEYFSCCELISIDPAHAARFKLDPANLPELDLQDRARLNAVLEASPLCRPDARMVLTLDAVNNPVYRKTAAQFAELFDTSELSLEAWEKIKADFAAYESYLAYRKHNPASRLDAEQLERLLAGAEANILFRIFAEDQAIAGVISNLCKLERLLLFCRYMLSFVNNFVSFAEFFDPAKSSMLQAGRLVMDGRSYHLSVWIDDAANHKKIAIRSNMCLLYLELTSAGAKPLTRKAAVAVTGGAPDRIYVGKPAFFIDSNGISYTGKVIDMVDGPISFRQTLFAPFRRLSALISDKIQKLTDFSTSEKQLVQNIEQGKTSPSVPPQTAPGVWQKFSGNGLMLLLAGGLSLAAIGAGLSFIFKSIVTCIAVISAMPLILILEWIAALAAVILVPMAIFAFLRLRKRNLTMFLEAGGWAVNLPMRLNMAVSRIFTRGCCYPPGSRFAVTKKPGNRLALLLIALILLAITALAAWYIIYEGAVW